MGTDTQVVSKRMGHRLADIRKDRGLTQQQLADAIGVKQYAVARFELGSCRVPVSLLPELARALDVTVDQLLGMPPTKAKPGPLSRLERQVKRIASLPKEQQESILQVLDMALRSA